MWKLLLVVLCQLVIRVKPSAAPWSTLFDEAGRVQRINIDVSLSEVEHLDSVAKDKCNLIATSKPTHVPGVAVPVTSSLGLNDAVFEACSMLSVDDFCDIKLEILGPKKMPGKCTLAFHGQAAKDDELKNEPMCVPVEVIGATTACNEDTDAAVGDDCQIGDDRVSFDGVCAHDASGSVNGLLGCVTPSGARFLRYLTRGLASSAFPEIPAAFSVANVGDGESVSEGVGWTDAAEVEFRRHGSASLCAGIEDESQKLPIHLRLTGQPGGAGLVLSTGASSDPSLLRARAAEDVMKFMGVPTPRTAFVRVYLNNEYLGLYVAEEELSAALLADQFVDGHVPNDGVAALINGWQPKEAHFVARVVEDWEPEGGADEEAKQLRVTVGQHVFVTTLESPWYMVTDADGKSGWVPEDRLEDVKCKDTVGSMYEPRVKFDTSSFRPFEWVPTDGAERRPVWKDLAVLHDALHSDVRLRDRESWRTMLEGVFDVEMFLKATATQVAIGNGDTYGRIPHNYMLYGPPCSAKPLIWVPYDFDAAWAKAGGENAVLPLPADPLDTEYSKDGLAASWSLLTLIFDDPTFRARYFTRLETAVVMLHDAATLGKLRAWQKQIAPFLDPASTKGENAEITKVDFDAFEQECDGLILAVKERTDTLYDLLPTISKSLAEANAKEAEAKAKEAIGGEEDPGGKTKTTPKGKKKKKKKKTTKEKKKKKTKKVKKKKQEAEDVQSSRDEL